MLPGCLYFRKILYDGDLHDRGGRVHMNYDHVHDDHDRVNRVCDDYVHGWIFSNLFSLYELHKILSFSVLILNLIYWEGEILTLFIENPSYFCYFQKFLLLTDSSNQVNYNCKLLQFIVTLFIMSFLRVNDYDCIYRVNLNENDRDHVNDHENDRNDHLIMSEEFS